MVSPMMASAYHTPNDASALICETTKPELQSARLVAAAH